jgi:putative CocE/NonD family hydrolase
MRSLLLSAGLGLAACAQSFEAPPALEPAAMAALARQLLAAPKPADRESGLDTRFRLLVVAGEDEEALRTMAALRELRRENEPTRILATRQHELFVRTRRREAEARTPLAALEGAFTAMTKGMDDRTAYQLSVALRGRPEDGARELQSAWAPLAEKRHLSFAEAETLLRAFETKEVQARLLPHAAGLMAKEEERRYLVDEQVRIRTKAGATICATVVRPRTPKRLPTAFGSTIYANASNRSEAVHSASEGFVGLVANSRGKRESPDAVEPYEHDGVDAAAVIDWIAEQPWSDGRVGMYGGSYDGFTQWAAAKQHPKALKSIMPSVPVAPGIDTPMEGGIFKNSAYNWIPYVTNTKLLDEADYGDWKRWNGLDWNAFGSGRPYRDLPEIDGRPNPLWLRWLSHPAYDAYWRAMIPSGDEFASITIPVLTTTGYYDGCSLSAQYYFSEHLGHRPNAEHYFLIGPYDHIGGQRRSVDALQGYRIDPAARIDIEALRYQWLDHTLRGGPKPPPLKGRVNYQVMGADTWKAASSIEAMANGAMKRYLTPTKSGEACLLTEAPVKGAEFRQEVDLLDHEHLQFGQPALIQDKSLDATHGFAFASAPLEAPLELSGLFSGELRFTTNKRDLDLALSLYEQTTEGDYLLLATFLARASWVQDRSVRHLLKPGEPTVLPFRSGRLMSRRLAKGSRLVLLLAIPRQPRMQMNLGSGKDVSDEGAADAAEPLRITWSGESFVTLPTWKDPRP